MMSRAKAQKRQKPRPYAQNGERIAQARRELEVRKHRDISTREMAAELDVAYETVRSWEAGETFPGSEASVVALAHYLGVTPQFLRYGNEPTRLPPSPTDRLSRNPEAEAARATTAPVGAARKKPA